MKPTNKLCSFIFAILCFFPISQLTAQQLKYSYKDGYIILRNEYSSAISVERESDDLDSIKNIESCGNFSFKESANIDSLYATSFSKEKIEHLAELNTVIRVLVFYNLAEEIVKMSFLVARAGVDENMEGDISSISINEIKELDKIISENKCKITIIDCSSDTLVMHRFVRFTNLVQYVHNNTD